MENVMSRGRTSKEANREFVTEASLASGLSPGEKVALNLSNQIADGDRVTVRDESTMAEAK
jgi:hypothetical protein